MLVLKNNIKKIQKLELRQINIYNIRDEKSLKIMVF